MTSFNPVDFQGLESVDCMPDALALCTFEKARQANFVFDNLVKEFLCRWLQQGAFPGLTADFVQEQDLDDFVQQGALAFYFEQHPNALERLLQQNEIAHHLTRSCSDVYFQRDAYEPMLSTFERRIYNLAARRESYETPFRYSSSGRQNAYGDSLTLADFHQGDVREDIGFYFGTRRSDNVALNLLARELHHEALFSSSLPIHVIAEGYMEEALRTVRKMTEQFQALGEDRLHCFILQRRHAAHDRHLGAGLVLMHTQRPDKPDRIIFCDTLKPHVLPPWWDKFKHYVDTVFPQAEGLPAASDRLEDGSLNLQRLHDGVPVRHQDIDCAFYTFSIARALIQLTKASPALILSGSVHEIVSQMTERMPEYFVQANLAKAPELVREENVRRRWQSGQDALLALRQNVMVSLMPTITDSEAIIWDTIETPAANPDLSVAA